jgi:hypothetical protein
VLPGHSEFGFGERAVAEVERLAWELVNRYGEVVVIPDWRIEYLRDPWKKR